jgi:hypothetical protein
MLFSLDNLEKPIKYIPHKREYNIWKKRLTEDESLIATLTAKMNEKDIQTSSFIPGPDWTKTPYQIIYEKACLKNEQHAAFFFGLILWDAVIRHPEKWCFKKAEPPVQGTVYFKRGK